MSAIPEEPVKLDAFLELARSRRAVRHFSDEPIPDEVLEGILEAGRWAPSGYNLQPVQFWVVTAQATKEALWAACFKQDQIREAPVILIPAANRQVARDNLERVKRQDLEVGGINEEYAAKLEQFVKLGFGRGPLGLAWALKAILVPLGHLFFPLPEFPSQRLRVWLNRQTALSAMNLMLAARAAGYDSCPMEGIDEARVRRAVGIPSSFVVPLILAVGRAAEPPGPKSRIPLEDLVHRV